MYQVRRTEMKISKAGFRFLNEDYFNILHSALDIGHW